MALSNRHFVSKAAFLIRVAISWMHEAALMPPSRRYARTSQFLSRMRDELDSIEKDDAKEGW